MASARVIFFGTLGVMSHAALQALLKHNLHIVSVVIPGPEPFIMPVESKMTIPVQQQPQHDTIEILAIKHDIQLIYVHDIHSQETFEALSVCAADFIVIACFPYILPQQLITLPNLACLNLHPSHLPDYRGPTPLFWQLKDGVPQLGVTLHQVNEKIDSGDILLQEQVRPKDGMRARAIDALLGEIGASLFVEVVRQYTKGGVVPRIQDSDKARYFPVPSVRDFALSTDWSARHAFNFMRGTDEWNQPYRIVLGQDEFYLTQPIAYSPAGTINRPFQIEGSVITIRFAQGLLQAELRGK